MGDRAVDRAAPWSEIDRILADTESSFDFLSLVSPLDLDQAWERFRAAGYEREPELISPDLDFEVADLRSGIDRLSLRDVDDVDIRFLLAGKREELRWQLGMLEVRDTPEFLVGSMLHYGPVGHELLITAQGILSEVLPQESSGDKVDTAQVRERTEQEVEHYRRLDPRLRTEVRQEEDQDGLQASEGDVLVPADIELPPRRLEALVQHEVGTHVITHHNGERQPLQVLRNGLADYDEVQEAFGVLPEYFADGLTNLRLRMLAVRTIAVHALEGGASFIDTFRLLREQEDIGPSNAFSITARIYACGGLTRDQIYLRGITWLLRYLGSGGSLEPLYVGKLGLHQIPSIIRLRRKGLLEQPALQPAFLTGKRAEKKLENLRRGLSPQELVHQ